MISRDFDVQMSCQRPDCMFSFSKKSSIAITSLIGIASGSHVLCQLELAVAPKYSF